MPKENLQFKHHPLREQTIETMLLAEEQKSYRIY